MLEIQVQNFHTLFRYIPFIKSIVFDGHETKLMQCDVDVEYKDGTTGVKTVTFHGIHGPVLKVEEWQSQYLTLSLHWKKRYVPYLKAFLYPKMDNMMPPPLARSF